MSEELRKCKPVKSHDGCGLYKPVKEFKDCMRTNDDGERIQKYSGWCRACRKRRGRARETIKRKQQVIREKKELEEALRLDSMFHGRPRTECERVNRYTGRATLPLNPDQECST